MSLPAYHSAVKTGEALPRRGRNLVLTSHYRNQPSDWRRVVVILSKQWRAAALFAGITIASVIVATLAMKPAYESEGKLQIDPPGLEVFSLNTTSSGLIDSEYIATEAQKLQTDDLALATIRALHLETNPEISGSEATGSAAARTSNQALSHENAMLRRFRLKLSIRRDPASRLVSVTFASHDPELSANVVNTLMTLLVQRNFEARNRAIAESSGWLSHQLDDIRAKMESSARALVAFGTKTGIADVDANSNTYAEKIGELNKQLVQAESDRVQFQSFLSRITDPESLPQVRNSPVVQALTQKLADITAQLAQSRVIYGPNHAEVRKLQNQKNELQSQLRSQASAIAAELWTNYRAARAREDLLDKQVAETTADLATLAQYNVLKKEAQADRDLYNSLYAKIKEAGIAAASKSSNIHVVSQARPLDHPTRPRWTTNIAAGLLIAVMGGIAIAFIKDRIQDRVHTADDMREWIDLPSIAVVPALSGSPHEVFTRGTDQTIPELEQGKDGLGAGPACFLLHRPNAPESEAVQALRTRLFSSQLRDHPRVILITSSLPGEGKTTLASNLAIALTKNATTCLVDADLRLPSISDMFMLNPTVGLEHYLQGHASLDQIIIPSKEVTNLAIIPSTGPTDGAIQLLNGSLIGALIRRLRERFDFVILDSPPLLPYADGLALSTLVDGVVLIGRAGQTPRKAITRSMELLESVRSVPVLAVVLNAVNERFSYRYSQ
jgi:polysaccharide biosynthesis transport protein